jgi:hypothetical protein
MASFPVPPSLTSITEERLDATHVTKFGDGSEIRFRTGPRRKTFVVTARRLSGVELSNLLEFHRDMKGAFDSTFDITLPTYDIVERLAFEEDAIRIVEQIAERFTVAVKVVQTR